MREFQVKLQTGEYIREWNGYVPFFVGCFYGDDLVLGGEDKFKHCWDWFSGIGDVEWWIKPEMDKLTQAEQDELLSILKRNKEFYERKGQLAKPLADLLGVEQYQIHRLSSKQLYDFIQLVDNNKWSTLRS